MGIEVMHRQFSSGGGTEKDVSRWLKEMGYRGQGLKRENLIPLCRGGMTDVWDALFISCRPPEAVAEMKKKLNAKLRRQAALESREKTKEDAEKRQRQIEHIAELRQQLTERDGKVQKMRSHVQKLRSEVVRMDGNYAKQKEEMETRMHRSKVLTAFASMTEDVAGSLREEMQHLRKHNATMKKARSEDRELGTNDFESVMSAMYIFTSDQLNEKLQSRPTGELLKPEDVIPMIEGQTKTKDPEISRLLSGVGKLYSHHRQRLTQFFTTATEDAHFVASQYEAKYSASPRPVALNRDGPQVRVIEEMQTAHLKAFLALKQMEERNRMRMMSLKGSTSVQRFLTAVEGSGCQQMYNCKLDTHCLQSEIETLEKEVEKLEADTRKEENMEPEIKQLYTRLRAHVERSQQVDLLIPYILKQLRHLRKDFDKTVTDIARKVEQELRPSLKMCLEGLRQCEDSASKELEDFGRYELNGRRKHLSLTETSPTSHSLSFPLLQRWNGIGQATGSYWIASLNEMATEMKQMAPLLKMESPDGLFSRVTEAFQFSLFNASLYQNLHRRQSTVGADSQRLVTRGRSLMAQYGAQQKENDQTVDAIDALLSTGHRALQVLQSDASNALKAFCNQPAFESVPWMKRNGKVAKDWVAQKNHGRST